ncbi:hypothetical protein QQ020_14905 [Fulvivirgaceae bacterium BMA12]|uniref:Uncharacterized protein n=1 Tax=Agaribacillus aureus TaxID=3051825 RepID=A0ABT8L6H9_9BACT|nr:hypothetical protein [Fulvivirgaceae bacterium BMA12]
MKLDELKNYWVAYDLKLNKNLQFNEAILRKINLEKSEKEMQKPLVFELAGIIIFTFLVAFAITFSIRFSYELHFNLTGLASALVSSVFLIFAFIKANKLVRIDYYNSSIIKLQKELTRLRILLIRLRRIELIMVPVLTNTILPITYKILYDINLYHNLKLFIIEVILILGISYPLGIWINKHFYDEKMKDAERLLKEIETYERQQ